MYRVIKLKSTGFLKNRDLDLREDDLCSEVMRPGGHINMRQLLISEA